MKKDIFATNNEFLKCEESESSQKQEHFSQWKPICDTIHTKQKSNKTNNKNTHAGRRGGARRMYESARA